MATLKQIRANRLNAQKCAGPSSAEGQARSSWNALKSGIHAASEVLPWEDPAERSALSAEYHDHHQPCTPEERAMVDNLVHGEFLSRRFRRSEVTIVISKIPAGANPGDDAAIGQAYSQASAELGRLQRRMDANNRAFHRDLDELRLLQAERPPCEAPPPLILVPPQPEPQPSETAVPEPDPPAPTPDPAADVPPAAPPDPQPPILGPRSIVSSLSQNLTPAQIATLTLPQAASHQALPTPAAPALSTPQPTESTAETQQLGSFCQNSQIPPPPQAPNPQPLTPNPRLQTPRGFNPNNPHHPPIELCHNCNQLGRILDYCMFQPLPDRLLPGRR